VKGTKEKKLLLLLYSVDDSSTQNYFKNADVVIGATIKELTDYSLNNKQKS